MLQGLDCAPTLLHRSLFPSQVIAMGLIDLVEKEIAVRQSHSFDPEYQGRAMSLFQSQHLLLRQACLASDVGYVQNTHWHVDSMQL